MTVLTQKKWQIYDLWLRFILHRPFTDKHAGLRQRRTSNLLQTLARRPEAPTTPEDHWYEVQEERLSDYAKRRYKPRGEVPLRNNLYPL